MKKKTINRKVVLLACTENLYVLRCALVGGAQETKAIRKVYGRNIVLNSLCDESLWPCGLNCAG